MKSLTKEDTRLRGWYFPINTVQGMQREFVKGSPINRRLIPNEMIYRKILSTIFLKIFKEIIYNGYEFKYRRLGKFSCVKYLPFVKLVDGKVVTNKLVNYLETFKLIRATGDPTRKVYFDNRETGGYVYRVDWSARLTPFTNKTLYRFKLEKQFKSLMTAGLKEGKIRARIIPNFE